MTHLATADSDPDFARAQVERFEEATKGHTHLIRHAANSAAALRPGIAPRCRPVRDRAVRTVAVGGDPPRTGLSRSSAGRAGSPQVCGCARESAGYGRRFVADEDTWIGVVPVGYADGFRRDMTGTEVVVDGNRCSVVGTVSMDAIAVRLDRAASGRHSGHADRRRRARRGPRGSRRRSTTRSSRGSSRARAARGGRCSMLEAAQEILAGEEAWIVGGAVRDELLGRPLVDLDIACREPEAAARRYARRLEGAPFPSRSATEPGAWRCPTSAPSTSRPCRTASTKTSPPATSRSTRSRGRSRAASRWIRSAASATSTARRFARSRRDLPRRPAPPAARRPPRGRARLPARRGDRAARPGERGARHEAGRRADPRGARPSGPGGFERLDELGLLAPLGGSLERLRLSATRRPTCGSSPCSATASGSCRSRTSCGATPASCFAPSSSGPVAASDPPLPPRDGAVGGRGGTVRRRRRGARARSPSRARATRPSRSSAATSSGYPPGRRSASGSSGSPRSAPPGRSRRVKRRSSSSGRRAPMTREVAPHARSAATLAAGRSAPELDPARTPST